MFGKKTLNLKSSYLRDFKEKNQEIWNVNSNVVFLLTLCKKQYFDFKKKKGIQRP